MRALASIAGVLALGIAVPASADSGQSNLARALFSNNSSSWFGERSMFDNGRRFGWWHGKGNGFGRGDGDDDDRGGRGHGHGHGHHGGHDHGNGHGPGHGGGHCKGHFDDFCPVSP
jgi:hypothetical protein